MNATKRSWNALYPLAIAGLLALAMVAAPAMAKPDKPYHETPQSGGSKQSREDLVAPEYIYICRAGSAIKHRIEPHNGDFFDVRGGLEDYRLAPRLGTCK